MNGYTLVSPAMFIVVFAAH